MNKDRYPKVDDNDNRNIRYPRDKNSRNKDDNMPEGAGMGKDNNYPRKDKNLRKDEDNIPEQFGGDNVYPKKPRGKSLIKDDDNYPDEDNNNLSKH